MKSKCIYAVPARCLKFNSYLKCENCSEYEPLIWEEGEEDDGLSLRHKERGLAREED